MPIRMDKDKPGGRRDHYPGGKRRPGSNSGGGIGAFLPLIISIVARKPKLLFLILIIALLFWIFGGGGMFTPQENNTANAGYGLGMEMRQDVYDQAAVYEPLADNKKNPLPEKVSLEEYAPARLNQGQQGSCVGWASSYAARTIMHARQTGINPNRMPFSPSYVYNQIALKGCQGSYMINAMETLHQDGDVPMAQFAYDERSCNAQPGSSLRSAAAAYRIPGYNRLSKDGDKYEVNMLAIKQNLSQGAPVVIGMQVGGSFMQDMKGRDLWIPQSADYNMRGYGGHAMCVIGYDDYRAGDEGAFQIMNSWGSEWGDNGIAWVRYKDFEYFVKEAYGVFPMGDANSAKQNALEIQLALVGADGGSPLALKSDGPLQFSTVEPVRIGDRFKVEVTNSVQCYIYVFGEETDGSSYVLFPYTPKHSPYCGITGTRLFPRDYSMKADDLGSRDRIAVVFTRSPIDYDLLNASITRAAGTNYGDKLQNALGDAGLRDIRFGSGEDINFKVGSMPEDAAIGITVAIDKR